MGRKRHLCGFDVDVQAFDYQLTAQSPPDFEPRIPSFDTPGHLENCS